MTENLCVSCRFQIEIQIYHTIIPINIGSIPNLNIKPQNKGQKQLQSKGQKQLQSKGQKQLRRRVKGIAKQLMDEQQTSVKNKFQLGYFRLTHQLLKHVKVNQVSFAFLRLIQTMQTIHFVLRPQACGDWSNTVFKYIQLVINYISVDYLVQVSPDIFTAVNIGVFAFSFVTILLMFLFAWKLKNQKRPPSIFKSIFSLINFSLYLFKTILQFPIQTVILIALVGSFQTALKVQSSSLNILLGVLNLVLYILMQIYLVTSFKDGNPFSDLIHAGQSYKKSILNLGYKVVFNIYLALDYRGEISQIFLIVFTVSNILWSVHRHTQVGFYKIKVRAIAVKLQYIVLIFGFISLIKTIRPGDEMSMLFFLILGYILCYIISQHIEKNMCLRALQKKMMFMKDETELQTHIIHLIRNIDTFQKRQSRVLLQGYLAYHHRQCKMNQSNCVCHRLKQVKQRTTQQKSQFFAFVIDILKQNLNRFNDDKQIHLLLSFVYQYRQKNRFQSLYSLKRTLKSDSFFNRLYCYHQVNLIQSQMIEDDSKDQNNKAVDVNKFFQYNNLIVTFEELLEECTRYHIAFWKELLEVNTDIKKLEKSGTMVTKSKDQVRDQFQKMLNMNPNNVHTLSIYGKFLIDVANQQASNIKYLQKADSILKNLKQSSKIDDNSNKYTDNAQTTIIVIDGSEEGLGEIVHTNNYIKKMLGYKRSELIGTNVNAIMPKVFGEHHNQVLAKYLSTSSDRANGKERMVPALGKDGYMIPTISLTKALANLENGIRIVGFMSRLQQKPQQQQIVRTYYYLLYRSDNEQIVGISQNCHSEFHIPCCLVYGNPYNNNNQLKIRNLFGFSFQKDKQGQVSTALQTSQVVLTLNSTKLSEQFIITRNTANQQIKDDLLHLDASDFGTEVKIVAKCILTYNYNNIPLRMLSIYKYGEDGFEQKIDEQNATTSKVDDGTRYYQKTQTDDFKDLKDFKNFISIKSQPSAISIINNICCVLMFIILSCIVTFIAMWLSLNTQNQSVLNATRKGLRNDLILPNFLFQLQKLYINRHPQLSYKPFDETLVRNNLTEMIAYLKTNERDFLPIKYAFINNYNYNIMYYTYDTFGTLLWKPTFIDEAATMIISLIEALLDSQLNTLYSNPLSYASNPYLMYLAVKSNQIFSIRKGSLQTLDDVISAYNDQVSMFTIIFYVLSAVMLFGVVIWFFTSIPYVLSVTKINNRVLSLFSLIPNKDVLKLIGRCYLYMKENLSEAVVNDEEVLEVVDDGPMADNQNESYFGATTSGLATPMPFLQSKAQSIQASPNTFKKYNSILSQNSTLPLTVEQKFSKMVNSQNQQKNKTIIKFLIISLLLIGYFLFNHFFALSKVNTTKTQITNLKNLGRRISTLTNVKLLLTEYIMNQTYQLNASLPTITQLNNGIIDQSYSIESLLLAIDIGTMGATLDKYNSGNLCNYISEYEDSAIFPTKFDASQCRQLKQGILMKGIKTSIVTVLEQVRTMVSMSALANRSQLLQQKMVEYETLEKYLENPMLEVIAATEDQVTNINASYELVLIVCSTIFLVIVGVFWRLIWTIYIEELNNKIWRTKGMLNIIPMRIITANQLLKNEFASGQLEKAVR